MRGKALISQGELDAPILIGMSEVVSLLCIGGSDCADRPQSSLTLTT